MPLLYLVIALLVIAIIARFTQTYIPIPDDARPILNIVLALLIVGMGLWLINNYVPMAGAIKAILNILVVCVTIVKVLQAVGVWPHIVRMWDNLTKRRLSA
jgi:hypothetical protein